MLFTEFTKMLKATCRKINVVVRNPQFLTKNQKNEEREIRKNAKAALAKKQLEKQFIQHIKKKNVKLNLKERNRSPLSFNQREEEKKTRQYERFSKIFLAMLKGTKSMISNCSNRYRYRSPLSFISRENEMLRRSNERNENLQQSIIANEDDLKNNINKKLIEKEKEFSKFTKTLKIKRRLGKCNRRRIKSKEEKESERDIRTEKRKELILKKQENLKRILRQLINKKQ